MQGSRVVVDINNMKTLDVLKSAVLAPIVILLKFVSLISLIKIRFTCVFAFVGQRTLMRC
jgi:hypothetical protein